MKTILVTGSTDGIGLETAKILASQGHQVLLHGRTPSKLDAAQRAISTLANDTPIQSYCADLSIMANVETLAKSIINDHPKLDVLINNAGVYRTSTPRTEDGFDLRFAVNTMAPYLLTQRLLPIIGRGGRVINLSSAAQSPVNLQALQGHSPLSDGVAYAQSKLALTMWSQQLAATLPEGPVIVAVNPGSFLGSKMVKEAYGVAGNDLQIGAKILVRAALSEEFADSSGSYYDNDAGHFASPHPDALDSQKRVEVIRALDRLLS